jgi:type II secretion system protein H
MRESWKLTVNASVCSGHDRRHGFTLIELMMVLVLMAIMTALIIPEMKGTYEEALLRSTCGDLADVFSLACSQAVSLDQLHRVRIDRQTGRYFVEKRGRATQGNEFLPARDLLGGEGKIDPRITIEIRRPSEAATVAPDPATSPASEPDLPAADRDEAIAFYPDGTADAREILLRDRNGFRLAFRINPITARVQMVELKDE